MIDLDRVKRWARVAALVTALGLILWRYQRAMDAHWRQVKATADSTIAAQRKVLDSLALVRHTDTLRLVKWQTQYVTLRDTVLNDRTDTLTFVRVDTVRQIVAAADSTIAACQSLYRTCGAEKAALTTQITALQSALHATKPRWYVVWGERLAWAGAGYRIRQAIK